MTKVPVNVFSPLSTYNIFLSFAIATTETAGEENILVLPDYNGANEACLAYLFGRVPAFSRVIRLVRGRTRETFFHRPFRKREVFRGIDELFRHTPVKRFFCFNDLKYQTQYALAALKRLQPEALCVYVEDGTGDYCEVVLKKKSGFRKLRNRLLYGRWWREISEYGTYPLLDGHRFVFPRFSKLSAALDEGRVRGVSAEGLPGLSYWEDARRLFGPVDEEAVTGRESVVLFVDPATYAVRNPGYFEKVSLVCRKALAEGKNVLFKGKDRNEYPRIGFEGHDRFFVLPPGIPSELVLLWFRKGIRRIAGGKSSALMTSRWLAPEIPCCCLSPFIREEGSRLGELFRGIGITSCESEEIP